MIKYNPVQRLPMGCKTIGQMESCDDGDWVHYSDYAELLSDLAIALNWMKDGHDMGRDDQEGMDLVVNPLKARYDIE